MKKKLLGLLFGLAVMAITCIAAGADYTVGDFTYVYADGGYMLTGYTGSDTSVVIPESVDIPQLEGEKDVKFIDAGAFKGKADITSVTLPHTLTRIDAEAFAGCTALTDVIIPSSVTRFDAFPFGIGVNKEVTLEILTSDYELSSLQPWGSNDNRPTIKDIILADGVSLKH